MQVKVTSCALECTTDEALTTQQVNRCHGSSGVIEDFVKGILRISLVVISMPSPPMP